MGGGALISHCTAPEKGGVACCPEKGNLGGQCERGVLSNQLPGVYALPGDGERDLHLYVSHRILDFIENRLQVCRSNCLETEWDICICRLPTGYLSFFQEPVSGNAINTKFVSSRTEF